MPVYESDGSETESVSSTIANDQDGAPSTRSKKPRKEWRQGPRFSNHGDLLDLKGSERATKRSRPAKTEPETVKWSSGEEINAGEAAYQKFMTKKNGSRGRPKSGKKPASRPRQARNGAIGVGSRVPGARFLPKRRGWVEETSDEEPTGSVVPDYLQERRARFEARAKRLQEGGLRTPPSYDGIEFSEDENLEDVTERPYFPNQTPGKYEDVHFPYSFSLIPAGIAQWLRDYQIKGAEFLHELFVYQKGGILGDDMGLGKTIQVIAFLAAAYGKTGDERDGKRMRKMRRAQNRWYPRVLIICPGTLIANWQDELHRWGWWHVDVFHGSADDKEAALSAARSGRSEIMITTYTTYRLNKDSINMISWDCCVADECHAIKERKSETTQAMNEVNSLCRIGLTGTAIQNRYEELWTLLNWTNPGKFGPIAAWKASISEPLELGQSHDATVYQLSRARKTAKKLVQDVLPQFFLRRMKTLIQDQLPKKSDRVVFCPLTSTQAEAYEAFLDSEVVQYIKQSAELCLCGTGKKAGWCCQAFLSDGSRWQSHVFPAIATLQKLSNHLALLIPPSSDAHDKQERDLETLRVCVPQKWKQFYAERDSIMHYANPEYCGKWRILKKLLKFWHGEGGNKVLVFSHSVRLLRMLQLLFNHTSYNVSYLDGSLKYSERYEVVTDFNTDPNQFVFLISTRAGGVGLNITSANKVVIVDPNWNPSYDLQAQDRAYRIGQARNVEVFRLVSQGTLEEIVYARQIYKQQQANIGYNATSERRYFQGVRGRKDQKGEIFGLNNLFAYENDNVVLRDIVNKTNIAESKADLRIASLELDDQKDEGEGNGDDELLQTSTGNGGDEEAAMSQLVAMITGDDSKSRKGKTIKVEPPNGKHDPVQAILASAGVQYTHENSEVVGSSKVETHLSRRAEAAVDGGHARDQASRVFVGESQSQTSRAPGTKTSTHDHIKYVYKPPNEIKKRQFCSMAAWAGYEDVVEFALLVEGWTQEKRRTCLDQFYEWRREVLAGVEDKQLEKMEEVKEVKKLEEVKKEEDGSEPIIKVEMGARVVVVEDDDDYDEL